MQEFINQVFEQARAAKLVKTRLEMRKRLQGCTLFFFVSISYGHLTNEVTTISDKMQTKTA